MENSSRGLTLREGLQATVIVGLIGLFLGFFALFNDEVAVAAPKVSNSITGESGAFFNSSGYRVARAGTFGFENLQITSAINATSGLVIAPGNYTVNATSGILTNSTARVWQTVILNYTFDSNSVAVNITVGVNEEFVNQTDILGLVLLAVFFGIAITALLTSFLVGAFGRRV